ncbi:GGDEF domain-containing protein [Acinetobacter sp. Z1]|uniref:GGDEF domain-containing protein n=1 Tax=Acinetobacter sp. Z1 TaxID=2953738 RepID=UPI0020C9E6DE|nr:GGDEF domain-containing protein [Acinetobacter sp. Z1]UTO20643.1 GGDEF domain-containing protein [Acinetobacter sp. Z1]
MNSLNAQYFILIVPSCLIFIGLAFTLCRLIFKSEVFLLWIGLAYAIPSVALFAQCLMSNAQLTLAAPFTGVLYLLGSWFGAYAISLKLNQSFNHVIALFITLFTLFSLIYFSYIEPQIWLRLIFLNISLGLIGLIIIPALIRQLPTSQSFDRWVLIFYLANVGYSFVRAGINFGFLDKIDQYHFTLTTSTWWLLGMSVNIILNILFAIVISGCVIKNLIQHLNNERLHDPLTHLLNRRGFFEKSHNLTFSNQSYFLVCLDIDHFKSVNDTWGHYIGDQILQGISQIMLQYKHPNDLIARFGGEEFICLIPAKDASHALLRTQRFKLLFEQTTFTKHNIKMTASYGLTQIKSYQDLEQALQRADDLLYQAKTNGRNQISFDIAI